MRTHSKQAKLIVAVFVLCFTSLEGFSIDPHNKYVVTPKALGVKYDSVKISTKDGATLHSWIYFPEKDKDNDTVLILAYPDKGNISYWVYYAATFAGENKLQTFQRTNAKIAFAKIDFTIKNLDELKRKIETELTSDELGMINEGLQLIETMRNQRNAKETQDNEQQRGKYF